jgi:hypothetical protein
MLDPDCDRDPAKMAAALYRLSNQAPPSDKLIPGLLDGHSNVAELVRLRLDTPVPMEA